jgi:ATP-binding cassette, subfamily C (CFTR/MRP), member 1
MYNPWHPPPAPPAFGSHTVIPERSASILSRLVFHWLSPLLSVGFTRPLEADDLWQLHDVNKATANADLVEEHFYRGFDVPKATSTPTPGEDDTTEKETVEGDEKDIKSTSPDPELGLKSKEKEDKKKKRPSLIRSIHAVYFKHIWLAGAFKLIGDTLQTTSPLVNKALLNWLTISFLHAKYGNNTGQAEGIS